MKPNKTQPTDAYMVTETRPMTDSEYDDAKNAESAPPITTTRCGDIIRKSKRTNPKQAPPNHNPRIPDIRNRPHRPT